MIGVKPVPDLLVSLLQRRSTRDRSGKLLSSAGTRPGDGTKTSREGKINAFLKEPHFGYSDDVHLQYM